MSINLFDLTGKTALITGSSRGLGLAIAEGMAAAGASVVLNGMNGERLEASASKLRDEGFDVNVAAFDVTDEAAVCQALERMDHEGIEIDILVNNAGIQFRKPMLELETNDWQRVIDTNLTSAFIVSREVAKRMVKKGAGKIVNIGSLTSDLARATVAPYTVAKGGIKMLTKSMAAEWGQYGIQANAIGPGYMLTDMNEALTSNPEFDGWVKGRTPAGRWGRPDELAGTAIYLSSAASDYVNGHIVYVDGGMISVL
ncbi:SDR family oxidoreductase [Halomonas dongshanensis]|uniref:SDR family oxidoreductase n=1 Tax=Halomonas dongshanensis TaxID=2890835 RepID=A0ABT2EDI7_9GAMM|nr:SDR family oxidoreductase [Halomonas dongshanensis]MCS2609615.1 SDR family oxidoreductase [Halomonas dongshanensis]